MTCGYAGGGPFGIPGRQTTPHARPVAEPVDVGDKDAVSRAIGTRNAKMNACRPLEP
ncbi:MAG: hypothetical protein JJE50_09735 [Actinomycetales bacterium]|nr:hypothetical protein [Actinomycetales bacterium]